MPSAYFGLIVLEAVTNKLKYEHVLKEIMHFVRTHQQEVTLQVSECLLTLRPLFGSSELTIPLSCSYFRTQYFRIALPDEATAINQAASSSKKLEIARFAEIAWECLCIFKENFPARVELFYDGLERLVNLNLYSAPSELLRRMLTTLQAKRSAHELLKRDDLEDVFFVLELASQSRNSKGILQCLSLLDSELVPPYLLATMVKGDIVLLQRLASQDSEKRGATTTLSSARQQQGSNKDQIEELEEEQDQEQEVDYAEQDWLFGQLRHVYQQPQDDDLYRRDVTIVRERARSVLAKVLRLHENKAQHNNNNIDAAMQKEGDSSIIQNTKNQSEGGGKKLSVHHSDSGTLLQQNSNRQGENVAGRSLAMAQVVSAKVDSATRSFDEPHALRSVLFQLRETTDIERICFLLDNLVTKNLHTIDALNQKLALPHALENVIVRYCNGDLGIDQSQVTRYCIFHNRVCAYLVRACMQPQSDLRVREWLLGSAELISQITQLLEEGVLNVMQNVVNTDENEAHERQTFLTNTLKIFEWLLHEVPTTQHSSTHAAIESSREICCNYLGLSTDEPPAEADLYMFSHDIRDFFLALGKLCIQAQALREFNLRR